MGIARMTTTTAHWQPTLLRYHIKNQCFWVLRRYPRTLYSICPLWSSTNAAHRQPHTRTHSRLMVFFYLDKYCEHIWPHMNSFFGRPNSLGFLCIIIAPLLRLRRRIISILNSHFSLVNSIAAENCFSFPWTNGDRRVSKSMCPCLAFRLTWFNIYRLLCHAFIVINRITFSALYRPKNNGLRIKSKK